MPKGNATTFSQEVFDEICKQLAEGKSLRSICKSDDMPNASNVFVWLNNDKDLQEQYARAREKQADTLFDECLSIADSAKFDDDAVKIQRNRLQIDTRKWMAGKLRPKKYGEKLELTGDSENPVAIKTIERVVIDPKATDSNA